jgi:alpha-tubulin suppressor-like RCC1 family protein
VATNADGSCALMTDGTVKCWGMFLYVEEPPHAIAGLAKVKEIALAAEHACALLEDETVQCWGRNSCYQLGSETARDFVTPVTITGLDHVVHIAANALGARTLAVRSDGIMWHWGTAYDWMGGCSGGATSQRVLEGPDGIVDAAGAGGERFVALKADGTVRCWNPDAPTEAAQPLAGLENVTSMTGGAASGCAVLTDHTVRCWGPNDKGQVGDGTTTDRPSPTPVSDLANVASVSMSSTHTCALLLDGSVKCWGVNTEGQLGDGTHTERHAPVSVVW